MDFIKKNQKAILHILWTVSVTAWLIYLVKIGYINYESNDDFFISIFSGGFLGKYTAYNINCNIVMGWLVSTLNRIFSSLNYNWSFIYYLFGIIMSYVLLGNLLTHKKGLRGTAEATCILFLSVTSLLHSHNFTKTGAFILIVGSFMLAYREKEDSKWWSVAAFALMIMGSMYRINSTIAVLPFIALCFIYGLYCNMKKPYFKAYLIQWISVGAAITILWIISYVAYHANPGWNSYLINHDLHSQVIDYPMVPWEDKAEEYIAAGWSQNDYNCFIKWVTADIATYNSETFANVVKLQEYEKVPIVSRFMSALKDTLRFSFRNILFQCIIASLVIISVNEPKKTLWGLLTVALTMAELGAVYLTSRTPERALFIPLICGIITMCLYNTKPLKPQVEIALVAYLYIACDLIHPYVQGVYFPEYQDTTNEFLQDISQKQENLYVWDIFFATGVLLQSYGPLDGLPEGYFSNSVFLGGWPSQNPIMAETASRYGGDGYNILELLATNDNVYYVAQEEPPAEILTYIQEHYSPEATCVEVDSHNAFRIYQYSK